MPDPQWVPERNYMRSRLLPCSFFPAGARAPGPTNKFVCDRGIGRVAHPDSRPTPNPAPLGIGPTGFVLTSPVSSVGYLPHWVSFFAVVPEAI